MHSLYAEHSPLLMKQIYNQRKKMHFRVMGKELKKNPKCIEQTGKVEGWKN